jgi:hypothetical protein
VLWVTLHIAISSHFCQTNEYDLKKPDTFVTSSNLSWPHQSNWFPRCYSTKMLCFYVCRSSCSVGVPSCLIFQIYLVYQWTESKYEIKGQRQFQYYLSVSEIVWEGNYAFTGLHSKCSQIFFLYVYCMSNRFQLFLLPSFKKILCDHLFFKFHFEILLKNSRSNARGIT